MRMKKWIGALCLLLCLLLCGCAKESEETVDILPTGGMPTGDMPTGGMPTGERPSGAPTGDRAAGEKAASGRSGQGEAQAALNADHTLTGRVESIVGNEAVLTPGEYGEDGTLVYDEETAATYLLPVGMPIGDGDFSSVASGMVLQLSFNEADAIIGVSILSR